MEKSVFFNMIYPIQPPVTNHWEVKVKIWIQHIILNCIGTVVRLSGSSILSSAHNWLIHDTYSISSSTTNKSTVNRQIKILLFSCFNLKKTEQCSPRSYTRCWAQREARHHLQSAREGFSDVAGHSRAGPGWKKNNFPEMSGEEFTRDACRTVVAQLCEAVDCVINDFSMLFIVFDCYRWAGWVSCYAAVSFRNPNWRFDQISWRSWISITLTRRACGKNGLYEI